MATEATLARHDGDKRAAAEELVELPVTFRLGSPPTVDSLRVHWPDGTVQEVAPVEVDATLRIIKPD